jgi:methionine-rich copper-binding protein CopC
MFSLYRRKKVTSSRRPALRGKFAPILELLEDRTLFSVNPIVAENQLPGTSQDVWDVQGIGDPTIQGYATDMSVNHGQTVSFKIDDQSLAPYHINIYRIGYYQGNGARLVATVPASQALDVKQPAPLTDPATQLIDAGNWSVTASWAVPATAVSGVYVADLVRNDTGGMSQILFIVRADESHSDILYQTSDATWQAYNTYGGNSVYGSSGDLDERAFAVSYNRPLADRGTGGGLGDYNSFFYAEFPMVEWLEQNGYDVSYFTNVDTDRNGSLIDNHKIFLSSGHDEYWSGNMRTNVQTALATGVNLAFFSGNEVYWKTEYAPSMDSSHTPDRTLITYKDSLANQPINPDGVWTGLWADQRFSPPRDGGVPANALTGTQPMVNRGPVDEGIPLTVSSAYAGLRFWRNTAVASLQPGQSLTLGPGDAILGYEWDTDIDNGFRPAGLFDLQTDTVNTPQVLFGYQNAVTPGVVTHSLTLYRASSGALVFGAGTVQWSFGLNGNHDGGDSTPDLNIEQATVNLFADMNVQPGSLAAGLVSATASTDTTGPTSVITSLTPGASFHSGTPIVITGTAADTHGGIVATVEVSTDGGQTWHRAVSQPGAQVTWTYQWTPGALGSVTILSRAVNDSGYLETPSAGVTVKVLLPTQSLSLWGPSTVPQQNVSTNDISPVEVGLKFQTAISGTITGIRFYKGSANTGTHLAHLWDSSGNLLGTATFTNETASGWQQVNFANPISVTAGVTYIASYYAPNGGYSSDFGTFMFGPTVNGPLQALVDNFATGGQGVFRYGVGGGFPTSDSNGATNYYVDVVFFAPPETVPPTVISETPAPADTGVPIGTAIKATFNDQIDSTTISFVLQDANHQSVPATVTYSLATNTATLTPTVPLAGFTTYTATMSGVTDLSGNTMTGPFSWSFTTGSATAPPLIISTNPTSGANNVAAGATVSVTFNEAIQIGSVSFLLTDSNNNVATGSVSYSSDQLTATFTPSAALNPLSNYTITVSGATDIAGNVMVPATWQFQTVPAQYTLWNATATPAVSSASDSSAIELGLKFQTDQAGTISGVRFFKGSANTGQHLAHLWDANGNLLATAIFASETSFGWQQANFATPVSIQPHTTYVVSYYAPVGGYAVTGNFFSSSGVDVGPLHGLSNAAAGGNGVFSYGVGGRFPVSSFNATNYWVDPVYNLIPDTTPPTITSQSPQPGATNVSNNTAVVSVTFSEPVQSSTISIVLKDSNNNVVPGTLSFDSRGQVATLTPNSPLAGFTTYAVALSGVADLSGNTMSPVQWSFRTGVPVYTLWNSAAVPAVASANDSSAVELGVKFTTDVVGAITAIRFYKGAANTGTHVGHLWDANGNLLATATFTSESAGGWQQVNFATPVVVFPNTTYIASYFAPAGGYSVTSGYFSSSGIDVGPLHAPSDAAGGGNGVFRYTAAGAFPNSSFNATNYWVDVVFGIIPVVLGKSPAPNSRAIAISTPVTVTFSESVVASSLSFTLQDPNGNAVAASVSYDDSTHTATLTPNAPLAANTTYTATIAGAQDSLGHGMPGPVTWSFKTIGSTVTLWDQAATPTVTSANDSSAIELGVKFESSVSGSVAGLFFYKGALDTGTHVAHLWDASGNLLATATFTNETASGWQQVNFAAPVPIDPNTVYIASYYAPNGGYAVDGGYFANSGVVVGPLQALSNAASGGNGLFRYGNGGGFPTSSFNASNYWVDVLLSTVPVPPTVVAETPADGATSTSVNTTVSATFNKSVQSSTIVFSLLDPSNNPVAGSLAYNNTTHTVTFTPTAALAYNATYTATVSGALDNSGLGMSSPVTWTFTTVAASAQKTIWSATATPSNPSVNDPSRINLGVKFTSDISGYITGVRFYKGSNNTGTHVGYLWDATGNLLASATFTFESATGWQQVNFSSPVAITANTVYVASYYAPNGDYAADGSYFANAGVDNGTLHALSNAAANGNGLFAYGSAGLLPTNSFNATNYWVDVVFCVSLNGMPPAVVNVAPLPNVTGVTNTSGGISAMFSEQVQPNTISFVLQDSNGNAVPGSASYDSQTPAATFTPNAPLAIFTTYTATVSGAVDQWGNTMSPFSWTFTTGGSIQVAGLPASATAGSPQAFTITALNPNGSTATGYLGTIHFTSSDPAAVLPANYTFLPGDQGVHTFSYISKTAGTWSLTATDIQTSNAASVSLLINPASASVLVVAGYPSSTIAGVAQSFTVTALDPYGNVATGYSGTIHFTSSDSQAVLPADYTFLSSDAGVHTFSATLKSAGTQSMTATDTITGTITGTDGGITVNSTAASLVVSGFSSPTTAGVAGAVTVTVKNAFGNIVSGYSGTVHFISSDGQAVLPADYSFSPSDAGVHVFSATLKSAGTQSITATDIVTSAISGTEAGIGVNAAAAVTLIVSGFPSATTAGIAGTVTVTAKDAFGNTAAGYLGTVRFTSTDSQAVLPANYAFTAADAGSHTFSVTFNTAASQSITGTDTATGTIAGTQASVTVNPAAASRLVVSGFPTPVTINQPSNVTVTARDAFGNTVTGYSGTVHFSSSDAQAVLPADYAFTGTDAGSHTFSVSFKTVGGQSITATDTATSTIVGTQTGIMVTTPVASTLVVSGFPAAVTAGVAGSLTVTAKDAFGNTVTGYQGTVHFTSSDGQAVLPTNYVFKAIDAGIHVFSVTLKTSGSRSITVTDTSTAGIAGTQAGITVNPAAASALIVSGFASPATAGVASTVTVTARDAFGNIATGYGGTVHFTSTDSQAALPANYVFTAGDAGVHVFSVILKTAGARSITGTDTVTSAITGTQAGITVSPAAASTLVVAGFGGPTTAGVAGTFTVTAKDAFGNTAPSYRGTVRFTSSDSQAVLPANYAFTATDGGVHAFSATLKTAGSQSITGTDAATGTITGTQAGITISPAAASTLLVSGFPNPTTAGVVGVVAVSAKDAFGNTATSYRGTIHFTSTDSQATLPANYTFTAADVGRHVFNVTLKTSGSSSITATDTATSTITGTQANIQVNPAAASSIRVTSTTTTASKNVPFSITLTVVDAFGNLTTAYAGTVHFTSSDGKATLPSNYSFTAQDAGVHVFSVTLKTSGTQTITAKDTVTGSIKGTISIVVAQADQAPSTLLPSPDDADEDLGDQPSLNQAELIAALFADEDLHGLMAADRFEDQALILCNEECGSVQRQLAETVLEHGEPSWRVGTSSPAVAASLAALLMVGWNVDWAGAGQDRSKKQLPGRRRERNLLG